MIDDNRRQKRILRNLLYIYSKYLNKKKLIYFQKYRSISKNKAFNICNCTSFCTCSCSCSSPNRIFDYDSIPSYKYLYPNNKKCENITNNNNNINNNNYCKYSAFVPKVCNSNGNNEYFWNSKENQNKSAFYNYINLNKSNHSTSNGNSIYNNFSSNQTYYTNNTSHFCQNNSHNYIDEKSNFAEIKLSNNQGNVPDFHKKTSTVNDNKKTNIIEFSNNVVVNSKNNYYEGKKNQSHNSSKNIALPLTFKVNHNLSYIKNNCSSLSTSNIFQTPYNNTQKKIITETTYKGINNYILSSNKENIPSANDKILDQQILEFLNNNNEEKENIIKKMKNQAISNRNTIDNKKGLKIFNENNKNRIINLNNLNNFSYINNNYNYYWSNNKRSNFNKNNNFSINNLNNYNFKRTYYTRISNKNSNIYDNQKIFIDKYKNKNSIKNTCTNKRPKNLLITDFFAKMKREPLNLNYNNYKCNKENINTENIMESGYNLTSNVSNNMHNYDLYNGYDNYYNNKTNQNIVTSGIYNIPIPFPIKKKSSFQSINDIKERNTTDCTNMRKNEIIEEYDSEKNHLTSSALNEVNSSAKIYKNLVFINRVSKSKINKEENKNIIQKSLNLFFSNSSNNNSNKSSISEKTTVLSTKSNLKENKNIKKKKKAKKKENGKIPIGKNLSRHNSLNNITKKKKSLKKLKISKSVINVQFPKGRNEKKIKEKEKESIRLSMQSMNDSKIMELANKVIEDEDNLNKNEIIEILNSKREK